MRAVVTGAAGFIGSHLVERLLAEGHEVLGVDSFTETYSVRQKRENLSAALVDSHFALRPDNLLRCELPDLLRGCEVLFHLAGQPGVRESWGTGFESYARCNVVTTERLLGAARRAGVGRVVFASSSSVYGAAGGPRLSEDMRPQPVSPYGVTKLAAEELCFAYQRSFGLPVIALRYFTVYGPRQRPDMAFSRFIAALGSDRPVTVYGDGHQRRDFTFVDDIVSATVQAAQAEADGIPINVGTGTTVSISEVIDTLAQLLGCAPRVKFEPSSPGDMRETQADLNRAAILLRYAPQTDLYTGLQQQLGWTRKASREPIDQCEPLVSPRR